MIEFYFLCIDEIVVGSLLMTLEDAYRYSKRYENFIRKKSFQIYRFDGIAEELIMEFPVSFADPHEIKTHPLVQEKWKLPLILHQLSWCSGKRLGTR